MTTASPVEGYLKVAPDATVDGDTVTIDARGVYYRNLNEAVRAAFAAGAKTVRLQHVNGQRYIGNGISGTDLRIECDDLLEARLHGAARPEVAEGRRVGSERPAGRGRREPEAEVDLLAEDRAPARGLDRRGLGQQPGVPQVSDHGESRLWRDDASSVHSRAIPQSAAER